jgi:hypothetical protein
MALASYAITTLDAVKGYLGRPLQDDGENDTWIETQINLVSGMVESYCQRVFTIQSFSNEVHNGNGRSKIRPLYYPVTQLSTVTADETHPTDAEILASVQYKHPTTLVWTDIETDADNIIINSPKDWELSYQNSHNIELLEEVFPEGDRNIRISYKAGVSGSEIAEVEQVVIEMVAMQWKESGRGTGILGQSSMSNTAGNQSENIGIKSLKPEWKSVLDRYKRKQYQ